jgi:hypothetical protein
LTIYDITVSLLSLGSSLLLFSIQDVLNFTPQFITDEGWKFFWVSTIEFVQNEKISVVEGIPEKVIESLATQPIRETWKRYSEKGPV